MLQCTGCGNTNHGVTDKICRTCGTTLPERKNRATARGSSNYSNIDGWRRYTLHRVEGTPIELDPNETFTFGRSNACSLTVRAPNISRKHAEIAWKDGDPVLRDLGSENGTLVNGKPVWEHKLADGDEFVIGAATFTFHVGQGLGSLQLNEELLDSAADTQCMPSVAMSGDIEEVSIYEILDTLSYNKKTGILEVFNPWDAEGFIGIHDGEAKQAKCGAEIGDAAVLALLAWGKGRWRFMGAYDHDLPRNVHSSVADLLDRASGRKGGKPAAKRPAKKPAKKGSNIRPAQRPTGRHKRP